MFFTTVLGKIKYIFNCVTFPNVYVCDIEDGLPLSDFRDTTIKTTVVYIIASLEGLFSDISFPDDILGVGRTLISYSVIKLK